MDVSSPTPIVLKKGGPLCEGLKGRSCSLRTVCPREKFACCINEDGNILLHYISDDTHYAVVKDSTFMSYDWVVPVRAQQDCVLDQNRDGSSEFLAVTTSLECRWYTVSEKSLVDGGVNSPKRNKGKMEKQEDNNGAIKLELMATLKTTELCNKLRKMDFPDNLTSVDMLGSEDGQAIVLFNSCLVCRFSLDVDFGSVALVGCYLLQPSLHSYQDEQLPSAAGPLSCCAFVSPLLFAMTDDGIIFVLRASNGANIGVINVMQYCYYHCGKSCDLLSDVAIASFGLLCVSHDLINIAVPTPTNHVLLINVVDYFQTFPYHYHPDFMTRTAKLYGSSSSPSLTASRVDMNKEEELERQRYGGLFPHNTMLKYRGTFPGSYSWTCRLGNLDQSLQDFDMDKCSSVNLHMTSELPWKCANQENSQTSELEPLPQKRMWYEAPHLSPSFRDAAPASVPLVTGIQACPATVGDSGALGALRPSLRYYQSRCVLPATCSVDAQVVHVEFVSEIVVVHYGLVQQHKQANKNHLDCLIQEMTLYHTDSHCYYSSKLPESSMKLRTFSADALVYFVNDHSFFIVTYNLSQEEFVGKMLMFGSANVAEEVCHLNRWDKCSLPINALETALELRQLDTLAFFLRSRDTDEDSDSDMPTLPPLPPDQLDTVIKLLIDAIQRNCKEEHHYQFAGQLLIMTLEFVIRMIKTEVQMREGSSESIFHTLEGHSEERSAHSYVSLSDLTSYIQQLRSFLPKATVMLRRDQGTELLEGEGSGLLEEEVNEDYVTEFLSQDLVADWNKLSPKEVIRDALLRNCLPLAQSYLMQRKPEDSLQPRMGSRSYGFEMTTQRGVSIAEAMDSQQHSHRQISTSHTYRFDSSLHSMQVTGVGYVMEALQRRNIKLAKSILCHLGMDVSSSLKRVCFYTLDRELRDFLCALVDMNETETAALDYVHILERYYPLQSYDQAVELYSKQSSSSKMVFQSTALPVLPGIISRTTAIPSVGSLQDLYPENFGGDYNLVWDPNVLSPSSLSSGLYIQAPLAVVLTWDTATKQRLFLENFVMLKQADGSDCERLVNKQYIFEYHISHSNPTSPLQFLMSMVPSLEDPTPCPPYVLSLLTALPHATEHVHNIILDELARNGIFTSSELQNFSTLLHRLGRVNTLFNPPHPLIKSMEHISPSDDEEDGVSSSGELISMETFHKMFLSYCIEHKFFSLMSHYLDLYSLGLTDSSIAMLGLDVSEHPWVNVLLNYRRAALSPADPHLIFQASLSCSKMLLSLDPKPPAATVMGLLQSGHTLMALSTLMFAPVPLEQAISESNSGESWYAEVATLKHAIAAYTSLQAAIFPPAPTTLTPAQSQDITVYELLQDSLPFDVSQLFKWQNTNTVSPRHEDQPSSMSELPHFSSTILANKFAVSEHLDYIYYLRRGQPSFAFANFVATKLVGHSNPSKRIRHLVSRVYWVAMHDLSNSRLAASCAALLEMLGKDSTCLRVDLQSASRIVKYEAYQLSDGVKGKESEGYGFLVSRFCQLQKTSDITLASSLLDQLETATDTMVTSSGVEDCGLEAEECWQLVQGFCICHHLPPSTAFITSCAKHGQWLPLLCHAQLNNIPSLKVLKTVEKHLGDSSVKEHLALAISSIDSSTTPLSPLLKDADQSGSSKSRKRRTSSGIRSSQSEKARNLMTTQTNLRAKFYSRVGLQREVTPQPDPKDGENADGEEVTIAVGGPPVMENGDHSPPESPQVFPAALLEDEFPGDLFSAIFKSDCHSSPWRALLAHAIALHRPLLAILAACYKETIPVECICAWMFSTLKPSMFEKLTTLMTVNGEISVQDDKLAQCAEVQWRQWSCLDLSLMLISAMQHSPSPAAHFSLAFKYFDENSPLLSFLRFHEEFALRNDYEECKKHLQDFRLNIDKCREYTFSGEIGDLCWVEQVASSMASHMLVTCPTSFERSHLLKLLAEAHFGEHFKCSVLNFNDLHQMTYALNKAGLDSGVAFTVKEHFSLVPGLQSLSEIYSCRVRVDTNYVLGLLLEKGEFETAKQYAAIVNSTASQITIKEAEYNLKQLRKSSYWKYRKARLNFWHQCNSIFLSAKVDPDSAAEFFQFVVDNADRDSSAVSATEKALLLALILKWMTESEGFKVEQTREYEKKIWLSHIQSAIEQEEEKDDSSKFSGSPLSFLLDADTPATSLVGHTSLLSYLSISAQPEFKGRRQLTEFMLPDNVSVSLDRTRKSMLNEKESEVFEVMLGRLMNAGLLSQARELAALFEHNSIDLVIVLICIQFSQLRLTPAQLTEDVLSLMSTRQPRHFTDPCTTLLGDPSHNWETAEYVRMMSMLSDRVLHARLCCDSVITCFRISLALNVSYATIVNTDPFETISNLLSSTETDKYILATKLISTCNLTAEEVANYLSKCISSSLEANGEIGNSKSSIFPSKMSSNEFQGIIQLLSDPALLGNKLLHMAKSRASSKKDTYEDMSVQVELLIRAHDCYTMGCSVDGISQVLVVAKNWVQIIEKGKHYQLLVRLLTGISRYHEMSYIIGLLIEHDQFENLCHAGVEKEEQFRVALIEYLHKYDNDSDKLMMVAMHFNMLREQAKTTEVRAKKELARIKRSQLVSNNAETVKKLKCIFDDFRLAARMYAKENCLYHSENCLSQARLVALQLSFTAVKQVINLDGKSVMKFMEEQPFTEALIVADAYKQSVWTDWINPLYKRVIVGGDFRYLREYERAFTMTATVYSELASKFQRDRERTQDTINNMKTVLGEVKNLILKQKLATQLGLQDIFPTKYDIGYMNDLQRL